MIRRLLIANRGEIALRIIRACREMEIEAVAVYSEADRDAPYVRAADRTVCIGPAAAAESYLSIPAVLKAVAETNCDAVHPGYGFLAENPAFAEACAGAGIIFVGPPAAAIAAMGSKIEARRHAAAAGVAMVPGLTPTEQTDAAIIDAARVVGLPVLIKAAAGGGGKGMRVVREDADLNEAIAAARREAQAAFGDGTLYIERLIDSARHIEVQVFGDAHGHLVHLFERDCSVQRRHQKIIEESPSPIMNSEMRDAMGKSALSIAAAVGYRNAGTVEFLVEGSGPTARFFFLEMNTRLQVEHPVTEVVAGVDLVRAQLLVAAGAELPWRQDDLVQRGHAIECRIYAEDPGQHFLPQAGRIALYREPSGPGIRIDAGVVEGSEVTVDYDPLLAKLIAQGETRAAAIRRAITALRRYPILGIRTNIAFLLRVLEHARFRGGAVDTAFLDGEGHPLCHADRAHGIPPAVLAAAAAQHETTASPTRLANAVADPWDRLTGWRT